MNHFCWTAKSIGRPATSIIQTNAGRLVQWPQKPIIRLTMSLLLDYFKIPLLSNMIKANEWSYFLSCPFLPAFVPCHLWSLSVIQKRVRDIVLIICWAFHAVAPSFHYWFFSFIKGDVRCSVEGLLHTNLKLSHFFFMYRN